MDIGQCTLLKTYSFICKTKRKHTSKTLKPYETHLIVWLSIVLVPVLKHAVWNATSSLSQDLKPWPCVVTSRSWQIFIVIKAPFYRRFFTVLFHFLYFCSGDLKGWSVRLKTKRDLKVLRCTVKNRWSWKLSYSSVVQIARNLVLSIA